MIWMGIPGGVVKNLDAESILVEDYRPVMAVATKGEANVRR